GASTVASSGLLLAAIRCLKPAKVLASFHAAAHRLSLRMIVGKHTYFENKEQSHEFSCKITAGHLVDPGYCEWGRRAAGSKKWRRQEERRVDVRAVGNVGDRCHRQQADRRSGEVFRWTGEGDRRRRGMPERLSLGKEVELARWAVLDGRCR